jgi:hypothetical protein
VTQSTKWLAKEHLEKNTVLPVGHSEGLHHMSPITEDASCFAFSSFHCVEEEKAREKDRMTPDQPDQDDAKLAAKIVKAMKEYDAADATRKEKAVVAGKLLAEAHSKYPAEKAFERFLQLAGGIQVRRARDLIAIALGRKNFEQHQIDNAAAQQRHRDRLKAEKIEREKKKAALPKPDPKPTPKDKGKREVDREAAEAALRNAAAVAASPEALRAMTASMREQRLGEAAVSASCLQEFKNACRCYLPKLSAEDLSKAYAFLNDGAWRPKPNKEVA